MSRTTCNDELTRSELLDTIQDLQSRLNKLTADGGSDQYREMFERSADAILIIDGDTFVDCNQATVNMLRYSTKSELLETHPSELSPPMQPDGRGSFEKANEMIAIAFEKGSHRFEWDHLRADGSVFPVEVLLTPVKKEDRTILHTVWRDITERKHLESDLLQARKMEAMGKLTGGIAHDFNNLLVAILGYTDLLDMELPGDSKTRQYVEQIRLSGQRAATLVGQLLAFSRKQVLEPKIIELNKIINDLEKMLAPILGEDIHFVTKLQEQSLFIKADPGQLEQVIVNLATNARDAMTRNGTLIIETRKVLLDEHSIGETLHLDSGAYAVMSVSDSGHGISQRDIEKIFDPFFTTKGLNEGTGLGLSSVHGIIKQSGGDIAVLSELEKGTVFKVYLPLTDERPKPKHAVQAGMRPKGSQKDKTILLVEDETVVSTLIETVLRREGYRIFVAANGREAITLIETLNLEPDMLLTDVIMPEMGGPELANTLHDKLPNMKILFCSGYTDSALTDRGAMGESVELIQKPFTPDSLIKRIREVLLGI